MSRMSSRSTARAAVLSAVTEQVWARRLLGLLILAAAAWMAFVAARADAFAALTAHAGWCISGGEGQAPFTLPTLLGHCALCWGAAGAAGLGAGLVASGVRPA